MTKYVDLKALPREHPLRNVPLAAIAAAHRPNAETVASWPTHYWNGTPIDDNTPGPWKQIKTHRIAACCFNDLGPAWTDSQDWRALRGE